MRWLRSLSAKLFPAWHERRLLRQLRARNAVGLAALKDLIKTVEMKERASRSTTGRQERENPTLTAHRLRVRPPRAIATSGLRSTQRGIRTLKQDRPTSL
jgi:hypothetical protein